jgi:tetratricopeptide (TPR) repeat protein
MLLLIGVVAAAALFSTLRPSPKQVAPRPAAPLPRSLILAPHRGNETIDTQIVAAQKRAVSSDPRDLEKLGWLFVQKARLSNDPGFYKLAEQCALAIEDAHPRQPDALLLRGHAAGAMHRFRDAENVARQLILQREFVLDYALLGDALMEQGRLDEAVDAYQKMADLRPCLQAYTRIAHLRWLKGDLEGAIEVAEEAAGTGTGRDPEPLAWALTKLAFYRLQNGELGRAEQAVGEALARIPQYAAALLLRGRLRLAQDRPAEALADLRTAARLNPLPDYQWTLADALRATGNGDEAADVEAQLATRGATADPRTYSLYLSTRGERADESLRLARQELAQRQDVFTYDALAWACLAAGRAEEAQGYSRKALAEGTNDARLLLHAGLISAALGSPDAASQLAAAQAARHTLLPSERMALDRALAVSISQK